VRLFRRLPPDATELVLRRLSKAVGWRRPSVADASSPGLQLTDPARQLCAGIDRDAPAQALAVLAVVEESLPGDDDLDQWLTVSLLGALSAWCSWPDAPRAATEAVGAALGPQVRRRWDAIRAQGVAVAGWIRGGAGQAGTRTPGWINSMLSSRAEWQH
jgi:hypothetical protein